METVTRDPVYAVRRTADIGFARVTGVEGKRKTLRLDLYQPVGAPAGPRPAVIWFHGGGFRPGNARRQVYIPLFARAFAARGYAGIAPDYRVRADPLADFPGTIADCVSDGWQALAWVREHAGEYGIDPRRIVLAGGSAGGMLVLHMVHASPGPLEGIRAILDLWGTPGERWQTYEHIRPDSPPTFIAHGTADELVPYQNSVSLCEALERGRIRHALLTLPGAPHTPLMHIERIIAAAAEFLKDVLEA